jgi:hypothetical protein
MFKESLQGLFLFADMKSDKKLTNLAIDKTELSKKADILFQFS